MQTIKITFSSDGSKVKTEVKGIKGTGCIDTTKNLITALGNKKAMKVTSEFFETEQNTLNISNQ